MVAHIVVVRVAAEGVADFLTVRLLALQAYMSVMSKEVVRKVNAPEAEGWTLRNRHCP